MPRKKKEEEKEAGQEQQPIEEQIMLLHQPEDTSSVALRLQLLGLSKEILEHQSHLCWETHTKFVDVSIGDIIEGAKELYDFVTTDDLEE